MTASQLSLPCYCTVHFELFYFCQGRLCTFFHYPIPLTHGGLSLCEKNGKYISILLCSPTATQWRATIHIRLCRCFCSVVLKSDDVADLMNGIKRLSCVALSLGYRCNLLESGGNAWRYILLSISLQMFCLCGVDDNDSALLWWVIISSLPKTYTMAHMKEHCFQFLFIYFVDVLVLFLNRLYCPFKMIFSGCPRAICLFLFSIAFYHLFCTCASIVFWIDYCLSVLNNFRVIRHLWFFIRFLFYCASTFSRAVLSVLNSFRFMYRCFYG